MWHIFKYFDFVFFFSIMKHTPFIVTFPSISPLMYKLKHPTTARVPVLREKVFLCIHLSVNTVRCNPVDSLEIICKSNYFVGLFISFLIDFSFQDANGALFFPNQRNTDCDSILMDNGKMTPNINNPPKTSR